MLTFSGLLNALDGVAASEERILFMTTNYPDRLDPALIRPGRVDVQEYIGWVSEDQARKLFMKFYDANLNSDRQKTLRLADEFIALLKTRLEDTVWNAEQLKLSAAALQGYFILHKANPEAAISHIKSL